MKKYSIINWFVVAVLFFSVAGCTTNNKGKAKGQTTSTATIDPLPSWNESKNKTDIINYLVAVTDKNSPDFIPVKDRIATFDNDGTIWSEQPAYFQLFFAIDEIKALAPQHPEWKNTQPFKAVLDNDMKTIAQSGERGLLKLVMVSHAGMSTRKFKSIVKIWADTAKNPTKHVLFTALVYKPMLELLIYLQANHFKTYIVSGGGLDFMRAIIPELYGIPPEQIIGSTGKTAYDYNNGDPVIIKLAQLDFIDDKDGKPININKIIGKKPVFCAGNSDGDLAMMQWTASNNLKSFMLYVHHTDSIREWAYDRNSHIGRLDKGLDEAREKGWTVIDMKNDWKVIYPFELEK